MLRLFNGFRRFGVLTRCRTVLASSGLATGRMMFVELFGAVGTFKIVTLTRNGKSANDHKQDGE